PRRRQLAPLDLARRPRRRQRLPGQRPAARGQAAVRYTGPPGPLCPPAVHRRPFGRLRGTEAPTRRLGRSLLGRKGGLFVASERAIDLRGDRGNPLLLGWQCPAPDARRPELTPEADAGEWEGVRARRSVPHLKSGHG